MKETLVYIYSRLSLLVAKPSEAWQEIAAEQKTNYFTSLLLPLMLFVMVGNFVGQVLFADFDVEKLIEESLVLCLSYIFGYFISKNVSCFMMRFMFPKAQDVRKKCMVIVAYSYSVLLLIDVLVAMLNDEDFICRLFYVVVAYFLWKSAPLFGAEQSRTKYLIVMALTVVLVPMLFQYAINHIVLK